VWHYPQGGERQPLRLRIELTVADEEARGDSESLQRTIQTSARLSPSPRRCAGHPSIRVHASSCVTGG
jgi:hypothetical protein